MIVEINNSFLDKIVRFANELILSLSPNCDLTASFKLAADVADLLKEHFDYSKGNGLV